MKQFYVEDVRFAPLIEDSAEQLFDPRLTYALDDALTSKIWSKISSAMPLNQTILKRYYNE